MYAATTRKRPNERIYSYIEVSISFYLRIYATITDSIRYLRADRDVNNKQLTDLSEQVLSVKNELTELSKTVLSALEEIKTLNCSGSKSFYKHSRHLPSLKPADYPGISYWHRQPWSDIRNRKNNASSEDSTLTLFFEDAAGKLVPKSEIQAVRNFVHAYFIILWDNERAPLSWTKAPLDLRINFVRSLEEEFEFLRYCDRHWKSEQIFMNYYPNWYSNKTEKKGKKPSKRKRADNVSNLVSNENGQEGTINDGQGGDNDNDNDQGGDDDNGQGGSDVDSDGRSKRPRIEGPESAPTQPAPTNVTTARKRVRSSKYPTSVPANDPQNNPL